MIALEISRITLSLLMLRSSQSEQSKNKFKNEEDRNNFKTFIKLEEDLKTILRVFS